MSSALGRTVTSGSTTRLALRCGATLGATALIPAEQARVVQLLVARVTVGEVGLAVDLRHEGLGAIAALVAPPRKQVA